MYINIDILFLFSFISIWYLGIWINNPGDIFCTEKIGYSQD